MVCSNIKWGTLGLIKGVNMRLFLSTLTEMDYIETLNKIESSYDDKGQGVGQKQRELISRLRRALNYNYELEVIAKMKLAIL